MPTKKTWLSPAEAAQEMSERAGYKITQDDIKQMRRRGKIVHARKINGRIYLYSQKEIREVKPPVKRHPQPLLPASGNV